MAVLRNKNVTQHVSLLRDTRPLSQKIRDHLLEPQIAAMIFAVAGGVMFTKAEFYNFSDLIFFICLLYFWWLKRQKIKLPFKLPKSAQVRDPNFKRPDGSLGMADGILYLGNDTDTGEEIWFTNSDARTHCLYLGTTGAGKTFGLKSYACNALTWASGFIFIDGKADTSLWSTLSAHVRRFGRDDDLLVMNYMTGNSLSGKVASNTLNPFSSGSASYLTNMLVSLMPDAEGDNAMWKERAVALISALMPCLVFKRDTMNIPMSIGVIRQFLTFKAVIKLSRDTSVPEHLRAAVKAYLAELPGYDERAFDDDGNTKQQPDGSMPDTTTPNQQHGFLSMQFTRSMQSLGDDYGFIFDTQAADVDMMDVVLNRRILIVLIPSLEKSSDETANLGKIIASTLRGMMGATLGNTVEGEAATAIDNKPTNSSTPFIAIFDEVGYYTAQGMAVMAAQARSLGFSLVFAGQDLPALEKRVKEEARSITANCNIKLFGKLEDPTQTKDFFEKTVGKALVSEVSGFSRGGSGASYMDSQNASVQMRDRATYEDLKGFNEGRAVCAFGADLAQMQMYNSDLGDAKVMRVHRFLPIPPPAEDALESLRQVDSVLRRLRNPKWRADQPQMEPTMDIEAMARGFTQAKQSGAADLVTCGLSSVAAVAEAHGTISPDDAAMVDGTPDPVRTGAIDASAAKAAEAKVAQEVPGGPLSWMEVIGGPEASSSPLPARKAPVVEGTLGDMPMQTPLPPPVVDTPAAPPAGPVGWEQIIGMGQQFAADEAKNAETAQGAALGGPLSWMDVIGGEQSTFGTNPVEERVGQQPKSAPPVPPAVDMPVAPTPPATQASDALAGTAGKVPGAPMSWMDVIGVGMVAPPLGDDEEEPDDSDDTGFDFGDFITPADGDKDK